MSNPFPIVERRHKLLVGLNWSTWVEGEGLTETAARHDLMTKCMAKHNQRTLSLIHI